MCQSSLLLDRDLKQLFLNVGLQVFSDSGANVLKKLKSELFLNREGNDEVLYYSCKAHLDELINSLEEDGKEKKLLSMIKAKYKVMIKHMEITETLTEKLRGMNDIIRLHNVHVIDKMQSRGNNSLLLTLIILIIIHL